MKVVMGFCAALCLATVMNTAQAARVYVSGGVTFSNGPLSVGIYSGPRHGYYGYHRYYPYYYYPRYYRYYPMIYRHDIVRHKAHHHRRYRSW